VSGDYRLSVVDQSPLRRGGTAAEALRNSVRLARAVEKLGYHRYWAAEHHNASSFAGPSPEILVAHIAARTRTLRVGSGGVLLTNTSALKVAEQFRTLSALHPGRIDLGIGRAAGGDPLTVQALAHPRQPVDVRDFPRQVEDLLGFLTGTLPAEHPFAKVKTHPGPPPPHPPEVWLLSSTGAGAALAGRLGLSFAFADFLCRDQTMGPQASAAYRAAFQPSPFLAEPRLLLACEAVCAPSDNEAKILAAGAALDRLAALTGLEGLLPARAAASYPMDEEVRRYLEELSAACLHGSPRRVHRLLVERAESCGTREIAIVTNCHRLCHRIRSYALIAESFGG
jgi:luciferase family oxidoreductase group 1